MAGVCNFEIEQGADWSVQITWAVDGDPVDLTNYTAAMQVRKSVQHVAALVDLIDGDGITLGGALGTIGLALTAAQTATLEAGDWQYDLELTDAAGVVTRVLKGRFVVDPEVTR